MSRHLHKNLQRGVKQPVAKRDMPPRQSRHGKPLDVGFTTPAVYVAERSVITNPATGAVEVVHKKTLVRASRPMTHDEMQRTRDSVLRATASTATYGKTNTPPEGRKTFAPGPR
jgi:hypothetical protein